MIVKKLSFNSKYNNQTIFKTFKNNLPRFKISPIISTMLRFKAMESKIFKEYGKNIREIGESHLITPDIGKYILNVGVANSPEDWCGPDRLNNGYDTRFPDKKNLFSLITKEDIKALRNRRAFLLLDQTHEGYQTTWLWQWFHNSCDDHRINPSQVIYVTGNLDSEDQYNDWASRNEIKYRMKVIAHPQFELVIYTAAENYNKYQSKKIPNLQDHIDYKISNLKNIKMFNILQKRPRSHRIWFFKYLYDNNLLDNNIISMNSFKHNSTFFEGRPLDEESFNQIKKIPPILPPEVPNINNEALSKFSNSDCGEYLNLINGQIMLDSWITVVSEASFGDSSHTCFISEKTFKPIVGFHPFIIFGNRGSLKRLRELGYQTFSPFINEEYDLLPTWERMEAIIIELKRLSQMTDSQRLEWYKNISEILMHNHKTLLRNCEIKIPKAMKEIKEYIGQ